MRRNAFASRLIRVLASVLCATASIACAANGASPGGAGTPRPKATGDGRALLTRAQARDDIRFAEGHLWALHPNLAFHRSKGALDADFVRAERELKEPEKRTDLYRALAPIVASVGDAHTFMTPFLADFQSYQRRGGAVFPLDVEMAGDRLVVTSNAGDEGIPIGLVIDAVAGIPTPALLDRLGRYEAAERAALRNGFTAMEIRPLLWIEGINPPYTIVGHRPGRGSERLRTEGAVLRTPDPHASAEATATDADDHRFRMLPKGIGYLVMHSFDEEEGLSQSFFDGVFHQLRTAHASALLIDLRDNTGGSTEFGETMLSHLLNREFRQISSRRMKVSAFAKQQLGRDAYVELYGTRAWDAPDGSSIEYTVDFSEPEGIVDRFDGNAYVLIGTNTFSAAAIFAAAAQDSHAAVVLGQESGGLPSLFGERFDFRLPVSGLGVSVSTKFFIRANGDASGTRGVIPDVRIAPAAQSDDDAELRAALAYIRKHKSP